MRSSVYVPAYASAQILNDEVLVHNVEISNSASGTSICFDIEWNGSWRFAKGVEPENWDAAWVFVKLTSNRPGPEMKSKFPDFVPGSWIPAHFSPNPQAHQGPPDAEIVPAEDKMGVFIYRREPGVGKIRFKGIKLAFKGKTKRFLQCSKEVSVAIFGIRMVYIPKGPFWLGDPKGRKGPTGCFYDPSRSGEKNQAYLVTSEEPIQVGPTKNLDYRKGGGDHQGPIPAAFPKGYEAFYMMRSHVAQSQYARFMNLLGPEAKTERFPYMGQGAYRFTIYRDRQDMRIATHGQRPCNFLAWYDGAAWAAWAGLRPMTEMEFTKACRGFAKPVHNEFAWGNTNIEFAQVIIGVGGPNEVVSGNCNTGNAFVEFDGGGGGQGPVNDEAFLMAGSPDGCTFLSAQGQQVLRSTTKGFKAISRDLRQQSGASFFGVMGLSGNLWEYCVTVGNRQGRAFTGKNGRGTLNLFGNPDTKQLKWPGLDNVGIGYRGGSWYTDAEESRLADRSGACGVPGYVFRSHDTGMRCARTAPKIGN